jgi:hypothetical protein
VALGLILITAIVVIVTVVSYSVAAYEASIYIPTMPQTPLEAKCLDIRTRIALAK